MTVQEQRLLPEFEEFRPKGEIARAEAEEARTTGYNDIDLNRWKEYGHIKTDSLWLIHARDKSGGHELDYHGNFIPQIATQCYLRYTKKGDVVLDLFLGSGTSAIEAVRQGRVCIGVELKDELVQYVKSKIPSSALGTIIYILQGDSTTPEIRERVKEVLARLRKEYVDLVILHPPYHDIIKFSDLKEDLSNAPSLESFLDLFFKASQNAYDLLAPGRFATLVIGDKYENGELIPLGFKCLDVMNRVGFRTKAIVVKNITGNERVKGKNSHLWRYRALAGGFYVFKHEYVMFFQKPSGRGQ